ncbi:unnamed protein product [Timema podura]|uniref:N-acetyltransferase domain-containing protein n=1 Tax=Timema podura TaxID=61482 RepID=A0ABN7P0H8_TIMPD|nr:unnamed protein product [Timema podura]
MECSRLTVSAALTLDQLRVKTSVAINWRNVWRTLQEVLTDCTKDNGWLHVSSAADRVVHYTLSQILYNTYEPPSDNELEVLYDIPDRGDQIKILWLQKAAIGFYTVKLKGTLIENTDEKYAMHMLDTAYIRTTHRRQGHGLSILTDLLQGRVGQDMGLSSPISRSMWRGDFLK